MLSRSSCIQLLVLTSRVSISRYQLRCRVSSSTVCSTFRHYFISKRRVGSPDLDRTLQTVTAPQTPQRDPYPESAAQNRSQSRQSLTDLYSTGNSALNGLLQMMRYPPTLSSTLQQCIGYDTSVRKSTVCITTSYVQDSVDYRVTTVWICPFETSQLTCIYI